MTAFLPVFITLSVLLGLTNAATAQPQGQAEAQSTIETETQPTIEAPSFQAGPNLLPGSLKAEIINNRGSVNLMLSVVHPDGSVNGNFSGPFSLTVNSETTELTFSQGYCNMPLEGERFESVRLDYWNSAGPQHLQYGFYTQGTRTREHPVAPWTSVLPPILAIALALIFREVIGSLLAGVVLGTLLLIGFQPVNWWPAIAGTFEYFILHSISDSSHASIILFSLLIGAMVAVISRNGGMYGVVEKLSVFANSARNSQLVTWFLGIAIFFDDYANTLVVGNTMRPVTDRFRVSREKLSYLVDSTAAPVAAVAFITTWIGAELDYIDGAISTLGLQESAYGVFLNSLSYAFYPYLTLIFMLMLILSKRDFSSMHKAEMRARTTGLVASAEVNQREGQSHVSNDLEPNPGIRHRWFNALLPVISVIFITLAGLWITGMESLRMEGHAYTTFWENESFGNKLNLFFTSDLLSKVIGGADSYVALIWASSGGLLLAAFMSLGTRTLGLRDLIDAIMDGFKTMLPALSILVLAWSLAAVTNQLHTAGFLSGLLTDKLNPMWLPAITFVLAGLISFSTGSSWSTMAILYPIILPLTYNLAESSGLSYEAIMPIFHNVTAMVLAGSVFGDHCSPISDTTILSSLSSKCNHVDHVRTQLPYALTVGGVSLFVGGVLSVMGIPVWLNLLLGIGMLLLVVRYVGKPVPDWK